MDGILDPFGNPVSGKGDENDQAYNLARGATAASAGGTSRIDSSTIGTSSTLVRFVFDVYGDQRHRKPRAKGKSCNSSQSTDKEDMPKILGNIHSSLQHHNAEWYTRYPANEADDGENAEYGEDNGS